MPEFGLNTVIAAIFALLLLYYVAKMLATPARVLMNVLLSGGIGAVILLIFNLLAGFINLTVGINVVTALIVGYLGLPGLVMLVAIQKMLG